MNITYSSSKPIQYSKDCWNIIPLSLISSLSDINLYEANSQHRNVRRILAILLTPKRERKTVEISESKDFLGKGSIWLNWKSELFWAIQFIASNFDA